MRTKTTEQFIAEATLKHNGFYDYSKVEYKNNYTKVIIICPLHGDLEQMPYDHLRSRGCRDCAFEEKTKSQQQFLEEATLKHNGFYNYSKVDYKNNRTKVVITCPIHGGFKQTPNSHLRGRGCPNCSGNLNKTTEQFIEEATLKHNGIYDYSKVEYNNTDRKVIITCPLHGDFEQRPHSHLEGQGCPKCVNSISKASQKWLDHLGIPNIIGQTREVRFKFENKIIIVDGYDPQTNTVYEFHGDYWHGNPNKFNLNEVNKVNKKTFAELLKETQRRSRLIKSNGYNLVSIWESDWNKINKETS